MGKSPEQSESRYSHLSASEQGGASPDLLLQKRLNDISSWSLFPEVGTPLEQTVDRNESIKTYFTETLRLMEVVEGQLADVRWVEWQVTTDVPILVISDIHGRVEFINQVLQIRVQQPDGSFKLVSKLLAEGKIKLAFVGDYFDTEQVEDWCEYDAATDTWHPKQVGEKTHDQPILRSFQALAAVLALKEAYPELVFLGQGNHDSAWEYGDVSKFNANQTQITKAWVENNVPALGEQGEIDFLEACKAFQVRLPLLLQAHFHDDENQLAGSLFVTHSTLTSYSPDLVPYLASDPTSDGGHWVTRKFTNGSALQLMDTRLLDIVSDKSAFMAGILLVAEHLQSIDEVAACILFRQQDREYFETHFWTPLRTYYDDLDRGTDDPFLLLELGQFIPGLTVERGRELLELKGTTAKPGVLTEISRRLETYANDLPASRALNNWFAHKAFLADAGITSEQYFSGKFAWVTGHSQDERQVIQSVTDYSSSQPPRYSLEARRADPVEYGQRFGVETQICDPEQQLVALVCAQSDGKLKTVVYDVSQQP